MAAFGILFLLSLWLSLARAADNEYQFNFNPYAPVAGNLSGFGNFGYIYQPDNYAQYRFGWPGLIYKVNLWLQLCGGLDAYYTDNLAQADTLELRPFGGAKLFVPNKAQIYLYNFTRYEYRDTVNLDTHDWSGYGRIRSRFGVEVPLTSRDRAWAPKTTYAFTDVEPFYRFDCDKWDPVRVRGGFGYVVSDKIRVELIYTANFTRSTPGSSLDYTDNTIELNIRVGLSKGLLGTLLNPDE